jgi:hypothetical protein
MPLYASRYAVFKGEAGFDKFVFDFGGMMAVLRAVEEMEIQLQEPWGLATC